MRLTFAILVCSALLLTACGSSQPQSRPLYSGSQGVIVSFPDENSFQQYEGDQFSIAIRLENDGAYSVNDVLNPGVINVIYDPSVLNFTVMHSPRGNNSFTPTTTFLLDGRSELVPVGGVDYADVTFGVRDLVANREQLTTPVTLQVCYPYVTTFVRNVCVDRDYYTQKNTPVCVSNTVTDQSQGAPIAVTSVEPRFTRVPQGVQPRFKITVTNLQDGYVAYDSSQTAQQLCSLDDFNKATWGRIKVEARLGSFTLDCGETGGVARFEGRTASIVCGVPTNDPSLQSVFATGANFESPLTIQLHYFYISSLTARVQVERP